MTDPTALVFDTDQTFDPMEADRVVAEYVCAVCHNQLVCMWMPGDRRVLVVCMDHGNIVQCGRVMYSTVSIEMEYGHRHYHDVIRYLSDLWGELIPPKKPMAEALRELGF